MPTFFLHSQCNPLVHWFPVHNYTVMMSVSNVNLGYNFWNFRAWDLTYRNAAPSCRSEHKWLIFPWQVDVKTQEPNTFLYCKYHTIRESNLTGRLGDLVTGLGVHWVKILPFCKQLRELSWKNIIAKSYFHRCTVYACMRKKLFNDRCN